MTLVEWLIKTFKPKVSDTETKIAEAKASKLRAMLNCQMAQQLIEEADTKTLEAATECLEGISLRLRGDTDKIKERKVG